MERKRRAVSINSGARRGGRRPIEGALHGQRAIRVVYISTDQYMMNVFGDTVGEYCHDCKILEVKQYFIVHVIYNSSGPFYSCSAADSLYSKLHPTISGQPPHPIISCSQTQLPRF